MNDKLVISPQDLELFTAVMFETSGYDFSRYAKASLNRRVMRLLQIDRFPSFAEFLYRIRHDINYRTHVVEEITVNVTEFFRDAAVWKAIRNEIVPRLAPMPYIRIWHAGCSTGQEVYSMALLLEEAGLLKKTLLYATDINPTVLTQVKSGIYHLKDVQQMQEQFRQIGGKLNTAAYFTAQYDHAVFSDQLRSRILPAAHNLVSDRSFNHFQLIFCRNVLIYFDKPLQDIALQLFDESLDNLGHLVLGTKENIRFTALFKHYEPLGPNQKIWQKR